MSKFAGAIELSYQGLDSFFHGLEGIIGPPDPRLRHGMTNEHMSGTESDDEFTTANYGVTTTSKVRGAVIARLSAVSPVADLGGAHAALLRCRLSGSSWWT